VVRRGGLSWLLAIAGALLFAKGSFAVYPFIFPSSETGVSVVANARPETPRFQIGMSLFKLSLPRQDVDFTVVEGTSEAALRMGPGHLGGSPLPGEDGNAVIAGHRDTHFRILKEVLIGDELRVDLGNREYSYRIVDIRVVSPNDTRVLLPQAGRTMTLITCYPFRLLGSAPERYIVQARLFDIDDPAR
jgi:LPXTG-site transpeptidase (sortase) family protein